MPAEMEMLLTRDGSPTLRTAEGITYHSTHGAVQESRHVFIQNGFLPLLAQFPEGDIRLFEMGFGTGLNTWLTAQAAQQWGRTVQYFSLEKFPVPETVWRQLRYAETETAQSLFEKLHRSAWNEAVPVLPEFTLHKMAGALEEAVLPDKLHGIYFDAFAPEDHPAAWTETVFQKLYEALLPGGVFSTYCSKGVVRRALQSVGFSVSKHPGPPGKREIVRAVK